jgi:hypothetical protein
MNDCDWVAANSKQEAIEWYSNEYGNNEDELDIIECDVNEHGMWCEIDTLPLEEIVLVKHLIEYISLEKKDLLMFNQNKLNTNIIDFISNITSNSYKLKKINNDWVIWKSFSYVLNQDKITQPYIIATTEV